MHFINESSFQWAHEFREGPLPQKAITLKMAEQKPSDPYLVVPRSFAVLTSVFTKLRS